MMLLRGRPPTPTTHQSTYIPNSKYTMYNTAHQNLGFSRPLLAFLAFMRWQHRHGPSLLIQAHDGPVVLAHEKHKRVFPFRTRLSIPFTFFTTVPSTALSILHQPPALGAGFTH